METATASATSSATQLRAELMELIHGCPVDLCNPEVCPLFHLRQMNYNRRIEWFNALSQEDLEYLAAYHHVCMKHKLQASQAEMA